MGPLTVSPGFWRAVLFVSCLFYKGYAEAFLLAPQSSVSGMNAQVSASCKSQHLHVAASSLRQSRSAMNHHGFGVSMGAMEVYVEPILDKRYVRFLSELSCESFYGQQSPLSVLNPIANLQRGLVLREIERDIETRISRYMEQPRCGRLLVAVDVQGLLVGFVDVSRTLYSKEDKDFKLALGPGLSLMDPADQFERRLYIANLAVSQKCRRRGVARQLMKAAHEVALELGKEEESVWLEVSKSNTAATELYKGLGYEVVAEDDNAQDIVRGAFSYGFERTTRLTMKIPLSNLRGEGQQMN